MHCKRSEAERRGLDVDDPNVALELVAEFVSPSTSSEVSQRYVEAIEQVCALAHRRDRELTAEVRLIGSIIAGKLGEDSGLAILLIDRLEKQVGAIVMALIAKSKMELLFPYRRARDELRRQLDAKLDRIDEGEKRMLESLIECGRAPSPFCVTPPLQAA
jgi:hypothetical protein